MDHQNNDAAIKKRLLGILKCWSKLICFYVWWKKNLNLPISEYLYLDINILCLKDIFFKMYWKPINYVRRMNSMWVSNGRDIPGCQWGSPCNPQTLLPQGSRNLPEWWSKCRWLPRRPSPWHCWEWGWSGEVTEPPPGVQTGNPSAETGTYRNTIEYIT